MKKIYTMILLMLLFSPPTAMADDWYEAEESSSCDYSAPASKIMADTEKGSKYAKNDEIPDVSIDRLMVERDNIGQATFTGTQAASEVVNDADAGVNSKR